MKWLDRVTAAVGLLRGKSLAPQIIGSFNLEQGSDNPDPTGIFERAYQNIATIYSCVFVITSFAAMVPYKLYRIPKGKGLPDKEELEWEHPASVLWRTIGPQETQYGFVEKLVGSSELGGQAFVHKVDGSDEYKGPPTEIEIVPSYKVTKIKYDKETGLISGYQIGHGENVPPTPWGEMFHIPYWSPYGHDGWGQATIEPLQRVCATDVYAEDHTMYGLKNRAMPGALFAPDKDAFLNETQRKVLMESWDKYHKGPQKAGRTGVLPVSLKLITAAMTNKDLDLLEIRKFDRDQIFMAFGVNSAVMGLEVPDRSRHEAARRTFAEDRMVPKLTFMQQYLNRFLWSDWKDETIIGLFDFSAVPALRPDMDAIVARWATLIDKGVRTINEMRTEVYGDDPVPWGDVWHKPMTLIPADQEPMTPVAEQGQKSRALPNYTPQDIRRLEHYARRVTTTEKTAAKWLTELFDKQEAHALAGLKRSVRDADDVIDAVYMQETTLETTRRILTSAAQQGIEHGMEPLGAIDIAFDLDNPALVEWLETQSMKEVKFIDATTQDALRKAVSEGLSEGETLTDLEGRISTVFDHRRNNAATIARTEVTHGVQETQSLLWKESGVVEGEKWLASMHPEGRHNDLHGQVVPLGGTWTTALGNTTTGPSMSGDPADDINCLCDKAPVVDKMAKANYMVDKLTDSLYPLERCGEGSKAWHRHKKIRELMTAG